MPPPKSAYLTLCLHLSAKTQFYCLEKGQKQGEDKKGNFFSLNIWQKEVTIPFVTSQWAVGILSKLRFFGGLLPGKIFL